LKRPCRDSKTNFSRATSRVFAALLVLAIAHSATAEILNSNTPFIRIRLGDNGRGSTNTVIYNAGIPAELGGLSGVTAQPDTISTNVIAGGSGVFEVRIVTDLNARNGVVPVQGTFSYDTSTPMGCITAATCGTTSINFNRIRWNVRDNDTHTAVTQFDGTANQVTQVQLDTNVAGNQQGTRHRNYFQYIFDNQVFLPAGTYEATMTINGEGRF